VRTGAPSKLSKAGNHSQPLFKAIQFNMEVGTGEFLVVGATAAGRAAGLGAKLGPFSSWAPCCLDRADSYGVARCEKLLQDSYNESAHCGAATSEHAARNAFIILAEELSCHRSGCH